MPANKIQPIRSNADYQAALSLIENLFGAASDSPEGKALDVLLILVEDWERKQNYELPSTDPINAIKFRMEQQNLSQRDLVPYIGSLSKVSEVLSGKRSLSLSMIRTLSYGLNISTDILIKDNLPIIPKETEELCQNASSFPLKEMKKRGWFGDSALDIKEQAEEILRKWLSQLSQNGIEPPMAVFPRATRQTAKTDKFALFAWCVKVLLKANSISLTKKYSENPIDVIFLEELKKLSLLTDGPKLACEKLKSKGIRLVTEDHLPKTHLDGALLRLNGEPVIGLTLRYDRIDNFWFTLFHELAHLINDFDNSSCALWIDDITLDPSSGNLDASEKRADETAYNALISQEDWKREISDYDLPSSGKVIELAFKWQVNPAIIAGRLRYQQKNYRLFPDFVGTGEIKPLFQ